MGDVAGVLGAVVGSAGDGTYVPTNVGGIVTDGVTDNYATINAAMTALGSTGGFVYLPPGSIAVSTTLVVPQNVVLFGAGTQKRGDNAGTQIIPTSGFSPNATYNALIALEGDNCGLMNLSAELATQATNCLLQGVYYNQLLTNLLLLGGATYTWHCAGGNEQTRAFNVQADQVSNTTALFWGGFDATLVGISINGATILAGNAIWFHLHTVYGGGGYMLTIGGYHTFLGIELDGCGSSGQVAHPSGAGTSTFNGGQSYNTLNAVNAPIFTENDATGAGSIVVDGLHVVNGGQGSTYEFSSLYSAATYNADSIFDDCVIDVGSIELSGSAPVLWGATLPGRSSAINYAGVAQQDVGIQTPVSPVVGTWYPNYVVTAGTDVTISIGAIYAYPIWVTQTHEYQTIGLWVATAGVASLVRLGIYADNGASYPGTRVLDAGTVAADTSAAAASIAIAQTLTPGLYWNVCNVVSATTSPGVQADQSPRQSLVFGQTALAAALAQNSGYKVGSTYTGVLPGTYPAGGIPVFCPMVMLEA